MNINYFHIFKNKVILAEQEDETPETQDNAEIPPQPETDLDKILSKSPKVTATLVKLFSTYDKVNDKAKDEIKALVSDVRCISYKPTTFRFILANGNFFDLKYNPVPLQLKNPQDFNPWDAFDINILGKKYDLSVKSEYEQAIDYIQIIQKEKSIIVKEPGEVESPTPSETPPEPTEAQPEEETK
jgi:hypothetical protein